ncbi:ribosome maturation factor RimP [Streptococcus chenjunshii]|uniref:Ribosome maturation factor RimP n=1 Tax=Streptococcus chenjunshii TaxID=2173853 RepID=A0A372KL73_9STRE|nr:ribosome maturation factor RimP [Streptococcus chenjunshii]AXQ79310.1 ribosome maturation factor RimP [Streptococcus chenjunshii]RFU50889.1 ribosome maturation factor RimP [Streptococcus chenjunshii]RFU53035.1 ribosome maturation factor RimP [Streptococcus chenjunshii]
MANHIVERVTEQIAPVIEAPFVLVDVEYEKKGGDYILSILVDKPGGITVEDTAELTDIISPLLDTIKPDPFPDQYLLEVSSPGLERPLKTAASLTEAVGSYISVSLYKPIDKMKHFEGDLLAFDGQELTLEFMDKGRKKTVVIPYQTVAKARLAVKF